MPPRRPDSRANLDRSDLNRLDDGYDDDIEQPGQGGLRPGTIVTVALLVVLGFFAIAFELFGLEPSDLGGPTTLAAGAGVLGIILMCTLKR